MEIKRTISLKRILILLGFALLVVFLVTNFYFMEILKIVQIMQNEDVVIIAEDQTNIYENASSDFKKNRVIGSLEKGMHVKVDSYWFEKSTIVYKIKYANSVGYILSYGSRIKVITHEGNQPKYVKYN